MTRLSVTYAPPPERRAHLAAKAFRLIWSLTCWTAVFAIPVFALAALRR